MAISQPPASAGPSIAAMTGFVRSRCTKPANPPRFVCRSACLSGADGLQIGAGGEHRAFVSEDADPCVVVVLELIDRGLHAPRDITVHGVAGLGTVQSQEGDVPLQLVVDHEAQPYVAVASRRQPAGVG